MTVTTTLTTFEVIAMAMATALCLTSIVLMLSLIVVYGCDFINLRSAPPPLELPTAKVVKR